MSRPKSNALTLDLIPTGSYLLHGSIDGKQIRRRSRDLAKMTAAKEDLERRVIDLKSLDIGMLPLRRTSLSEVALRGAEAVSRAFPDLTWREIEDLVAKNQPVGEQLTSAEALDRYLEYCRSLNLFKRSIDDKEDRIRAFLRSTPAALITEVTPTQVETRVLRPGIAPQTQVSEAVLLNGWFRFLVRKKLLRGNPCELDIRKMKRMVRRTARPVILTPEEARRLVVATTANYEGRYLPYLALSLFCFMRHGEVTRTVPKAQLRLSLDTPLVEVNPRKFGTPAYRQLPIPPNALGMLARLPADAKLVPYSRRHWERIRGLAGLGAGKWSDNVLRHTGISYRYQELNAEARRVPGTSVSQVTTEAGNSTDTAFRHYLNLPEPGAFREFYAIRPQLSPASPATAGSAPSSPDVSSAA